MQQGEWVLAGRDEPRTQTVLEGLNSCLDHRGTVYVPELGRSFTKHPNFGSLRRKTLIIRVAAGKVSRSRSSTGSSRCTSKSLPATISLPSALISTRNFDTEQLRNMIRFNFELHHEVSSNIRSDESERQWEFNLRDLMRWLYLLHTDLGLNKLGDPMEHLLPSTSCASARPRIVKRHASSIASPSALTSRSDLASCLRSHLDVCELDMLLCSASRQLLRTSIALRYFRVSCPCSRPDGLRAQRVACHPGGPTGSGKTSVVRSLPNWQAHVWRNFR